MHPALRSGLFLISTALLVFPAAAKDDGKKEEPSCATAYEKEIASVWPIVHDMFGFKAVFDNYKDLCTRHYPKEIQAVQAFADQLQKQTDADIEKSYEVVSWLIDNKMSARVPPSCRDDKPAREQTKKEMRVSMDRQRKLLEARFKKSGKRLKSKDGDLSLCQNLPEMKDKISKSLDPALENPLLKLSEMRHMVSRDPGATRPPYRLYRQALREVAAP